MFIYINSDCGIPLKNVMGVFTQTALQSPITKEFIQMAREEGFLKDHAGKTIKSFVVADEYVYLASTVPPTLKKAYGRVKAAEFKE